jgi:hypothetical protein
LRENFRSSKSMLNSKIGNSYLKAENFYKAHSYSTSRKLVSKLKQLVSRFSDQVIGTRNIYLHPRRISVPQQTFSEVNPHPHYSAA